MTDPVRQLSTQRGSDGIGDGRRVPCASAPTVVDSSDTITVDLTLHDVVIITVALSDSRDQGGDPAWSHPRVERLRAKLADAITRRLEPAR